MYGIQFNIVCTLFTQYNTCTLKIVAVRVTVQMALTITLRNVNELPHDKTNKMTVHPAKSQISLGIRTV